MQALQSWGQAGFLACTELRNFCDRLCVNQGYLSCLEASSLPAKEGDVPSLTLQI